MVLGTIHLTTLSKVRDEGPVKDGLHPAVNGLRNAGLVEATEDGYTLTDLGTTALTVYTEMTDKHRSLLMRLQRAHKKDEIYLYSQAINSTNELSELIDMGFVIKEGQRLYITDTGREFWQDYIKVHEMRPAAKKPKRTYSETVASPHKPKPAVMPDEPLPPLTMLQDKPCNCVDRQIVDLLAAKHPEIDQLRQAIITQRHLLDQLNLGKGTQS
ncbi:MAG: hypothetical protein ACFE0Q_20655 [Anaerolineae bacterium]